MSIYFLINENVNLDLSSRISSWILEETRRLFDVTDESCMNEIYEFYDIGMGGVTFEDVNRECYNHFYRKCKMAMEHFLISDRAKNLERNLIPVILAGWGELLEALERDPRYQSD